MRKNKRIISILLTIIILLSNSYEVLAAVNFENYINSATVSISKGAATILNSVRDFFDKDKELEKKEEEEREFILQNIEDLSNRIEAPTIINISNITKRTRQISWMCNAAKDVDYEISINDEVIEIGKREFYLHADIKEAQEYTYKVRYKINDQYSPWSDEIKKKAIPESTEEKNNVMSSSGINDIKLKAEVYGNFNGEYKWSDNCQDDFLYGPLSSEVEGIRLNLQNAPSDMKIKYQVYIKEENRWQEWKENGQDAGIIGEIGKRAKTIQAIRVKLEGNTLGYGIEYCMADGEIPIVGRNGEVSGRIDNVNQVNGIAIYLIRHPLIIDKDTVWKKSEGVKNISSMIEIAPNATLTIESGTEIKFTNYPNMESGIIVNGKLVAEGKEKDRIKISSTEDQSILKVYVKEGGLFKGENIDFQCNNKQDFSVINNKGELSLDRVNIANKTVREATALVIDSDKYSYIQNSTISNFGGAIEIVK